jgi:hypothetical protein
MTDERLVQAIEDYRRGAINCYDGPPGSPPRLGKMPPEYRAFLLLEISVAIDERGGKFLMDRLEHRVVNGAIVATLPTS